MKFSSFFAAMKVKASSSSISSCPRGGGEGGTQNDDDVQDGKTGKNFDAEEEEEDDRDVGYFCDDSDDDDSIYRRRRRGGQKSKPTWMEMFFNCVSCKQCVCLACVIILILLAVTIGKSALRDQRSKRHTGVDEFGRKIDQGGNVVHGRRAMMGIMDDDDDGDLTLPSYPEWIAKQCGWLLYLLALVYTLLGFRVLCGSGGQRKENDGVSKKSLGRRRVRFDVLVAEESQRFVDFRRTGTRDRRAEIRGRAVFTARESEQLLSCVLDFILFGFVFLCESFDVSRVSVRRRFDGFRHRVVQLYHRPRDDAFEEEKRKGNEEKE